MKKVLYVSYDGMTDPLGQSQVIPYLQGLTKKGYQFVILSFEKKDRYKLYGKNIKELLENSGIEWFPKTFTKWPPVLSKLYDLKQIRSAVMKLQHAKQFDFLHCRSYVAAGAGLHLSRKTGIPFLFDMRGFWVDERLDNGQWDLKKPLHRFFYKSYKKREADYFKFSAHIISLTWKGKDELVNKYKVPQDKITVIPCCVDLDHFDFKRIGGELKSSIKKELGIGEHNKVLTYLGSFGGWYLLKEMFDFFMELKKKIPELKFLFITPSPLESVINAAKACGAGIEDIIVKSAIRKEVPEYLSVSDWSVFFIKDGYSKIASSPTKQGEIMAMGIPIICNDVGDTGKIIEESGAGILVHTFSQSEFDRISEESEVLLQINKEEIRQSALEYFDLKKGVDEYAAVYKKISP